MLNNSLFATLMAMMPRDDIVSDSAMAIMVTTKITAKMMTVIKMMKMTKIKPWWLRGHI